MTLTTDRPLTGVIDRPLNRLLAQLPPVESTNFSRSLVPVELPAGMRLSEPGHSVEYVYFPVSGLIATDALTHTGESVLISLTGCEGFTGICGVLDHPMMMHSVVVQTPGRALRGRVSAVREEFERGGLFTRLVHAFFYMQLAQISQSVLCNRLHSVDQRLARWLLMMSTLAGTNQLQITHEVLAHMLGARRSTVTVAATGLQGAGLLEYRRGKLRIANRPGLEQVACECYGMVEGVYAQTTAKCFSGLNGAG